VLLNLIPDKKARLLLEALGKSRQNEYNHRVERCKTVQNGFKMIPVNWVSVRKQAAISYKLLIHDMTNSNSLIKRALIDNVLKLFP
jgi:hypothetical protein